ncbi:hypothetical protein LNJ03_11200 [Tenacibaculum dicentrarchi]|nr:hypothetical protein [Tenacibaculum dicentrarchi]
MNIENQIKQYLPFNVICEILDYKSDYVGEKFNTLKGYYELNDKAYFNFKEGRDFAGKNNTQFKMMLQPLSNIKDFFASKKDVSRYLSSEFLKSHNNLTIEDLEGVVADEIPYGTLKVLLEYHFDVFHLIPNGNANDISILTNEEKEDIGLLMLMEEADKTDTVPEEEIFEILNEKKKI